MFCNLRHVAAITAALAGGLLCCSAAYAAADLTLTGTLRDFAYTAGSGLTPHPDFEAPVSGLTTGMVAATLDAQGKPVYIGGGGYGSVSTAASFGQWYRDTPGVNLSTTYSITLNETAAGSGIYRYSNPAFFPIDNQLNGNQGLDHNFHFTYELAGKFGYKAGTGQVFSFSGDDDVWVYLNNHLAIDLGGIHGALPGSVNLDDVAGSLGLQDGQNYDFNMFFAERHTDQSNFQIETSLPIISNTVPEPSTWVVSLAGLAMLAAFRRGRGIKA